jgi:hypothetical protein
MTAIVMLVAIITARILLLIYVTVFLIYSEGGKPCLALI